MLALRRLTRPHLIARITPLVSGRLAHPIRRYITDRDLTKQEREESSSEFEEEEEDVIEKWDGVVKAIRDTTMQAFPASPPFNPSSPQAFQTYWRTVFSRLRASISADPNIPQYLTAPPVPEFTATLFDKTHGLCCPCGHPGVEPNISLENHSGVSKDDLIKGFTEYMYGERLPRVYTEPYPYDPEVGGEAEVSVGDGEGFEEFREDSGALVYRAGWMSGPSWEGKDGESAVYGSVPHIVMYCCRPDEYVGKRAECEKRAEKSRAEDTEREEGAKL